MRAELIAAVDTMRASETDVVTWAELKAFLNSAVNSFVMPSDVSHHPIKGAIKVVKYAKLGVQITIGETSNTYVTVNPTTILIDTRVSYNSFMETDPYDEGFLVSVSVGGVVYHRSNPGVTSFVNIDGRLHLEIPKAYVQNGVYQILEVYYKPLLYLSDVNFNIESAAYYNMAGVGTGNLGAI